MTDDHSKSNERPGEHSVETFRNDILDSRDRYVRLEPIYKKDDFGKPLIMEAPNGDRWPELKGFGFHMHSKQVIVDMEGARDEWRCDYVVMDTAQLRNMMTIFNSTLHIEEQD